MLIAPIQIGKNWIALFNFHIFQRWKFIWFCLTLTSYIENQAAPHQPLTIDLAELLREDYRVLLFSFFCILSLFLSFHTENPGS